MMRKRYALGLLVLLLAVPFVALAQTAGPSECQVTAEMLTRSKGAEQYEKPTQVSFGFPGITYDIGGKHYVKNMGCYMVGLYVYFISIAGILSTVMIMYGGIKYVTSFGNQSKIGDAKDTIVSAMIGLALALASYLILNFINPNLVQNPLSLDLGDPIPKIEPATGPIVWCTGAAKPEVAGKTRCGDKGTEGGKACLYNGKTSTSDFCRDSYGDQYHCLGWGDPPQAQCMYAKQLCLQGKTEEACLATTQLYRDNGLNYGCVIKGDQCQLSIPLRCKTGGLQVPCNFDEGASTPCWNSATVQPRSQDGLKCVDSTAAYLFKDSICCLNLTSIKCKSECDTDEEVILWCDLEDEEFCDSNNIAPCEGAKVHCAPLDLVSSLRDMI